MLDAWRFGLRVPGPRRQVDENWLVTYRGWVYGAGFGAQLGLAFVTIVTASATWVAFACALFAGSARRRASSIGAVFGLARALPILAGDEHLAVLKRAHGAGIDVQIGIELLRLHAQTARFQQPPE